LGKQQKSPEWADQWSRFQDEERFLFEDWILPATLEDFRDQDVLECGCGGGQHTAFVAEVASHVTAVDLNTVEIARDRTKDFDNVELIEDDIAAMDLGRTFDVVFCIGVIHHTDDPDRTFENLYRHCRPGGKLIVWAYSKEGNGLVRLLVEPPRALLLRHLPRGVVGLVSRILTALLYVPVYTVYRIGFLRFLPYFEYFANFRELSFDRNALNVFDKLNAPQTRFISRERCTEWLGGDRFEPGSTSIRHYAGVSYSLVGVRASDSSPNESGSSPGT